MFLDLFFIATHISTAKADFESEFNNNIKYSIFLPNDIKVKYIGDSISNEFENSFYFSNFGSVIPNNKNDYSLTLFGSDTLDKCPDIGVLSPNTYQLQDNTSVLTGKVDYHEKYPGMDFPTTYKQICWPNLNKHAYIMCAKKNKKVGVICINQELDTPEQAKQIFESFRWLEDESISSSTSTGSSISSSSESSISIIIPEPTAPIPWYTRLWQWLLSWF